MDISAPTFVSLFLQVFQLLTSLIFCSTFWRNDLSLSCLKKKRVSAFTIIKGYYQPHFIFQATYLLLCLSRDLCLRRLFSSLDLLLLLFLLWRLRSLLTSLASLSSSLLIVSRVIPDSDP